MISEYTKMALASIRAARFRSFLTMFGIIIGVSSVMTIVSLGEGVRQQVNRQVESISDSLVVVRPGKVIERQAFSLDSLRTFSNTTGSLSEKDWRDSEQVEGVATVVPIGILSGVVAYEDREYAAGNIITTTSDLPDLLNYTIEFGEFFTPAEETRSLAVIGSDVAEELFQENVPIGKSLTIRGQQFLVQGVFEQQNSGTFSEINLNTAVMVPYEAARSTGGTVQIQQLYVEAEDASIAPTVAGRVKATLLDNHAGQEDFSVLDKEEALRATNEVFYQLTLFIAGVAFISFIVGGIGIMNIMFATVSERTREIGIRKAIGATNTQILGQFVMEAVVLSVVGGIVGVALSFIANAVIRVTTDLQPVTTPNVILLVAGISIATGIVSGLLPAASAARKDPITSLRNEL